MVKFVIVFFFASASHANCLKQARESLSMCQSKSSVDGLDKQMREIMQRFNPKNGRMSPESCLGFSEAYKKFQSLTEQYIDSCWDKIDETDQTCQKALKSEPSTETIIEAAEALKIWRQANTEAPKLEHYLQPMKNLDFRLEDCLKAAKGQKLVNTNTDRGDAPDAGQIAGGTDGHAGQTSSSANSRAQNAQGSTSGRLSSKASTSAKGGIITPALCRTPGCQDLQAKATSNLQKALNQNPDGSYEDRIARHLALRATTGSADPTADIRRALARKHLRMPANVKEANGLNSAHTNIFIVIRLRYERVKSRQELF